MPKPRTAIALIGMTALLCTAPAAGAAKLPKRFFGIQPQTALTQADTDRMRKGGVGSIRIGIAWSFVQPSGPNGFDWSAIDDVVQKASKSGLEVFPFVYSTPSWVAGKSTTLPVSNAKAKGAWKQFLKAAVDRYGPGDPVGSIPIRNWQIWNEWNFHFFTTPVSASRYGQLLRISKQAIKSEDRGASIILGGLFARPKGSPSRAQDAATILNKLYGMKGIKSTFDGVALHPYAADAEQMKAYTEQLRRVMVRNGDRRAGFYMTEMGWGSQANSPVSFERGLKGQAKELRQAYSYLIKNRGRLNVKRTYWFSWKDAKGSCNFCDSVGLFRAGAKFRPKPAWFSFVKITGGKARR